MNNRIKQAGIFITGFVTAAAILISTINVFGDSMLKMIYVDFDPINISIDGVNKNPPDDMQPFIYNGRTYVALRYVGEAFGKKVDWVEKTRSISIADYKPSLTEFSDTFVNTPLSNYWQKSGSGVWTFDGSNGLHVSDSERIYDRTSLLTLEGFLPDYTCDYTVEFDAAFYETSAMSALFGVSLGKNQDDEYCDYLFARNHTYAREGLEVAYSANRQRDYYGMQEIASPSDITLEQKEYIRIKIQVKGNQADIYFNTKYITSQKLSGDMPAFAFYGTGAESNQTYYVRNFKITID